MSELQSMPNQGVPTGQLNQLNQLPPGSLPGQMAPPAQTDPLANLRDIHIPGTLDPWPPAIGWWLLAILSVLLTAYCVLKLYQWWRSNQYRREGVRSLNDLLNDYDSDKAYLQAYSDLLKRVALSKYPREMVANLTGEAWVSFLDKSANTKEFSMGAGQVLIQGNYETNPDINVEQLHQIGLQWIKKHTGPVSSNSSAGVKHAGYPHTSESNKQLVVQT